MRKLLAVALLFVLAASATFGGSLEQKTYLLWAGNADSTDHASHWFPVKGATKVIIRMFSQKAAWHISTDVDSAFTDSLATFAVLLSDSVSFIARDSAGTVVRANSNFPASSDYGEPYPICADSFSVSGTDTTTKHINIVPGPVNKVLRAPVNGSGLFIIVQPRFLPGATTVAEPAGFIYSEYMRIRWTPVRRFTSATGLATAPNRVNGLKGFKMTATVIYENK